jgi:hypothetical protein
VDQLCINQEDDDEKMVQVRMMDMIYRQCSQCIIWLGELGPETPIEFATAAIELIEYIANNKRVANPEALITAESFRGTMEAILDMSIFRHPWWQRVWTLQETVLPTHKLVAWGSLTLPWSVLVEACYARVTTGYTAELYARIDEYVRTVPQVSGADPLFALLLHVQWTDGTQDDSQADLLAMLIIWRGKRKATNPVDQVFGYLGLLDRAQLPHVSQCNYSSEPGYLFNATTLDLVLKDAKLLPLLMSPRAKPDTATKGIARWALDLAGDKITTVDPWYVIWGWDHWDACAGLPLNVQLLLQRAEDSCGRFDVLALRGYRADTVAMKSPIRYQFPDGAPRPPAEDIFKILHAWLDFARQNLPDMEPAMIDEKFARLMLGDLVRDGEMWFVRRPTEADVEAVLVSMNYEQNGVDAYIDSDLWPQTSALYSQVCNQTFFITESGLMSVGHEELEVGDQVWIFEGGKVPFLCRERQGTKEGEVDFVGFCYVQGLMFGEFFKGGEIPEPAEEVLVY